MEEDKVRYEEDVPGGWGLRVPESNCPAWSRDKEPWKKHRKGARHATRWLVYSQDHACQSSCVDGKGVD